MRLRAMAVLATGMVAAMAFTGCGGGSDSGGDTVQAGDEQAGDEQAADEQADGPAEGAGSEADGDSGGSAGGAVIDTRSIIYTGWVTIRVDDVDAAARTASELADRYGGFVGGDQRTSTDDHAEATLTLRIPSDRFTAAVEELGALGDEQSRSLETEDVTEEVVDVETRIATAEASVERTRQLLARAESIEDIVAIERELSEREAELASLQERQRTLADLTALSTITATLLGPEAAPESGQESDTGFLAGLVAGWNGLTASMVVLLTGLGLLAPWAVTFGVPAVAVMWWVRRRRSLQPVPATTPPDSGPIA